MRQATVSPGICVDPRPLERRVLRGDGVSIGDIGGKRKLWFSVMVGKTACKVSKTALRTAVTPQDSTSALRLVSWLAVS